jgi:hypothetical protein
MILVLKEGAFFHFNSDVVRITDIVALETDDNS